MRKERYRWRSSVILAALALLVLLVTLVASSPNRASRHDVSVGDSDPRDTQRRPQPTNAPMDDPPVSEWLRKSNSVVGVLTSSVHATPTIGDGLVDGVIVRIAPRFALTSTKLMSERGLARLRNASATHAVLFSSDASRVSRVIFQSEYSGKSDDSLIVLELRAEDVKAPIVPIVTAKPLTNFVFKDLSILSVGDVLDAKALDVDGVAGRPVKTLQPELQELTFFVEPVCGYKPPTTDTSELVDTMCVGHLPKQTFESPQEQWKVKSKTDKRHLEVALNGTNQPAISTNMTSAPLQGIYDLATQSQNAAAILLYDNHVVGLSIPLKTPGAKWAVTKSDKQSFVRLAAAAHRQFIDDATTSTAAYSTTDVFAQESKYPSYLASLVGADGEKLACQGVLIAPRYVLTTASCVATADSIHQAVFYASTSTMRIAVDIVTDHIATHPRFQVGDVTFNTAVLELASDVSFPPIQLDDGSCDVNNDDLARVRFADNRLEVSALTPAADNANCRSQNGGKFKDSEALCVDPVPLILSRFTAKDVVGSASIATYVDDFVPTIGAALVSLSAPTGLVLVGLGVGESTSAATNPTRQLLSDATSEVYVRVANSATFINAYVTGLSWSNSVSAKILEEDVDVEEGSTISTSLPSNQGFVVGLRSTKDGQNYCGGSLIAPGFVLTAAHCVVDGPPNYVSIGAFASSGVENEVVAVIETRTHPSYRSPHAFSFDVAILELAYASVSVPVKLSTTADFVNREAATMYGYGMVSATSGLSPTLRAVTMPVWSEKACEALFQSEVDGSMLCAGGEKGKDACTGDSGSPLVVTKADGSNVLVGVVSAGSGCGLENVPGLYARVQSMKSFVQSFAVGAEWEAAVVSSGPSSNGGASNSDGKSSSSSSIEPRDAASGEERDNELSTSTTGGYNVAQLVSADLSPLVRQSLMEFLLGSGVEQILTPEMLRAMMASDTLLKFYSTGDLSELMAIVRTHNKSALNTRTDRFGRWASGYATGKAQCETR